MWKANVPVPTELQKPGKALTLMVKAVDAQYNVQPESIEPRSLAFRAISVL